MIQSWAVYLGTMAMCCLFCRLAQRQERGIWVWMAVAVLTITAGLRKYTVGIDTAVYYTQFAQIARGEPELAYGLEPSFRIICGWFLRIWNNGGALLGIMALITNGCILWRLWDFRKTASFPVMAAWYYMGFYLISLNCSRQFVAVGIVIYATRFLSRGNPLGFFLGVGIGSVFHQSAIAAMGYPVLELVNWSTMERERKQRHLRLLLLCGVGLAFCGPVLERYLVKIQMMRPDVGLMLGAKLVFLGVSSLYLFVLKGQKNYLPGWNRLTRRDQNAAAMAGAAWLVGLCLGTLGYSVRFGERISWYFGPFEGVYCGILARGRDRLDRLIFGLCALVLTGYGFLYSMLHNSQGTMPYLFFWQ